MNEAMITSVDRLFEAHLTVADLETSVAFYRDRLGLELAHIIPARQAAFFWIGSRGTTMLGLWAGGSAPQKTTMHIAFAARLDDVIAAPRALQLAGITALDFDGHPTDEPVVLAWMPAASIYFRDPDGHLLEYIAMLAGDPRPDEGVLRWHEWALSSPRRPSLRPGGNGTSETPRDFGMRDERVVHVLGISGSLRSASSNSALVRAAVRLAPVGVELSIYRELADIPPFNPDRDTEAVPAAVSRFRAALRASDAVLISSPEYAHGVSGVLKNALDWVVSSGELIDKPIAVINASARATHAHASLCETLVTMSGRVIADASITMPLAGTAFDTDGNLSEAYLSTSLTSAIAALAHATRTRPAS
jgi:NAD(P)H-dependent FMN reductase/catechol 2,3-dioxygenase-like lactoylglutathione lyase family enzyme